MRPAARTSPRVPSGRRTSALPAAAPRSGQHLHPRAGPRRPRADGRPARARRGRRPWASRSADTRRRCSADRPDARRRERRLRVERRDGHGRRLEQHGDPVHPPRGHLDHRTVPAGCWGRPRRRRRRRRHEGTTGLLHLVGRRSQRPRFRSPHHADDGRDRARGRAGARRTSTRSVAGGGSRSPPEDPAGRSAPTVGRDREDQTTGCRSTVLSRSGAVRRGSLR